MENPGFHPEGFTFGEFHKMDLTDVFLSFRFQVYFLFCKYNVEILHLSLTFYLSMSVFAPKFRDRK